METIEQLLSDRVWLARLARGLSHDPHAADDALQEAWTAALESPPRSAHGLRGWIATVARRAKGRARRSARRRDLRERRVARDEALAPAATVAERTDFHRRVAASVHELPEPYRTTVWLRFYEDLPPAEIERRLGVPAVTVRTRLRRALARLRARLDAQRGERAAWLPAAIAIAREVPAALGPAPPAPPETTAPAGSPAAAGPPSGPLAPILGGVSIVSMTTKVALTAGAVIGLVLLVVVLRPSDPAKTTSSEPTGVRPGRPLEAWSPPAGDAGARAGAPAAPADPALADAPPPHEPPAGESGIRGRVLAPDGTPVAATVLVFFRSIPGEDPSVRHASTDSEGRFAFEEIEPGLFELLVRSARFLEHRETFEVRDPTALVEREIRLEPALFVGVRFETPQGERLLPLLRNAGSGALARLKVVVSDEPLPEVLPPSDRFEPGGTGVGRYHDPQWKNAGLRIPPGLDGLLEIPERRPFHAAAVMHRVVLAREHLPAGATEIVFRIALDTALDELGSIRLRVVDGAGRAIPEARIALGNRNLALTGMRVDADGSFERDALGPGIWSVEARASGRAARRSTVSLEPGEELDLGEVVLEEGERIRGRIVDASGAGVRAHFSLVELDAFDPGLPASLSGLYVSAEDGTFETPLLGPGLYAVVVNAAPSGLAAAVAGVTDRAPDAVVIELRPGTEVTLEPVYGAHEQRWVHLLDADGVPLFSDRVQGGSATPPRAWLAPGRYTLVSVALDGAEEREPFVVESSPIRLLLR